MPMRGEVRWASPTLMLTRIAVLSAAGIGLHVIESFIPTPLPFLKIGLANIATVLALQMIGVWGMFAVVILRITIGGLLAGSFMGPAFLLAIAGGVISAAVMASVNALMPLLFSSFGLSLLGSVTHVLAQVMVVRYVYVQNAEVFAIFPLLGITALAGGVVVGLASVHLLRMLRAVTQNLGTS